MRRVSPVLAVLLALLAACVTTHITRLHPERTYPRICPDGVAIFTSADKVGQPYVEVAVLSSSGDQDMTSQAEMYDSQRQKAAEAGANGLVLGQTQDPGAVAQVAHALVGTSANRKGQAIAIYIESDSARVRLACAGRH